MTPDKRIAYIDIARFYAMALVFFGHFIERIMLLNDPDAAAFYRCVNAFHMVLFVVISGFISKGKIEARFGPYLRYHLFSRLLPFVFFTLVFMGLAAVFPGDFIFLRLPTVEGYLTGLRMTALGVPLFCVPSWFLLLIFSVELIHFFTAKLVLPEPETPGSGARLLAAIAVFYLAGYFLNLYGDFLNLAKGRMLNFLFVHEAVTMYAFYLLGIFLRRKRFLMDSTAKAFPALGAVAMTLTVLFTFPLNHGPFNFNYHNSVVIMMAAHGNIFWFPVTAVAGSLAVLFLGKLTPAVRPLTWLGSNTLVLMCLNGIFYHYINPWAGKWVFDHFSGHPAMIFLSGLIMTILSLMLCIPLVYFFTRCLPQLTGRPRASGPWLPALFPSPRRG